MRSLLVIAAIIFFSKFNVNAQGCVAIRSTGMSCAIEKPEEVAKWQFNANYRYFKSFRHYNGKEEQKQRLVQHTDVRNYSHSLDLSIVRRLNDRWSLSLNMPLLANDRSSLYEHGFKERHSTHSYGLGDMRLSAYYWLLDPLKSSRFNVQLGAGIKFATGDYNYQDYWYNVGPNGSKELRTVDQSIQLGDGGTGLATELNAFYGISHSISFYANGFYLFNPRNVNGTRTYRELVSSSLYNETIMSVSDQYMARAGFSCMVKRFSFGAGARVDGVPVHDLIGQSDGFRRPGYAVAIEPGVSYSSRRVQYYLNVPVAVQRNRTQSITDKERTIETGKFVRGDAAFADYVINAGVSFKF